MNEEQTNAGQTEQAKKRQQKERALLCGLLPVLVASAAFSTAFTLERGNADTGMTGVPGQTLPAPAGSTISRGAPYAIGGTISEELRPGHPPVPIDLTFSNPNAGNGGSGADGVRVSSLQVEIVSVTGPNISGSRPCSATDFALTQFDGTYPFLVPQGTSSLASLGFASGSWPTIALLDRAVNQDGCKGAVVHLSFTATS